MSKESDLIKFMKWYGKQSGLDKDNPHFAEDWVSDYFDSYPLNKECECLTPYFIKEENYYGEMIDYCMNCKKPKQK